MRMDESTGRGKRPPAKKRKIKRQKEIIVVFFSIFMIFVLTAGCVAVKVISDVDNVMGQVYQPIQKDDYRNERTPADLTAGGKDTEKIDYQSLITEAKPIAVVLIGTDAGAFKNKEKTGRADAIIYCVLNPEEKSLTLLSIPRDTYVEMPGYNTMDKIGHSFAYGGVELTVNTVQNLLGLPVDAYAVVNFSGFKKVIDAIGGVTVENSFAFTLDQYSFPEGTLTLNGAEALAFCRMRKEDPEGDFGRARRQRSVLVAVAKKLQTLTGALNYQDILKAVEKNVQTDIDLSSALEMLSAYSGCLNNVHSMDTIKGYDDEINSVYYYMINEADLQKVTNTLRAHLGLEPEVSAES